MFYKHWKKVLLSLTAFFWASCDNSTSAEDDSASSSSSAIEIPKSSSATNVTESSSSEKGKSSARDSLSSSSETHEDSSSSVTESSSSDTESSSSGEVVKSSSSETHEDSSSSAAESSSSDTESSSSGEVIKSSSSEGASSSSELIDLRKCTESEEKECFSQIIYTQEAAVSNANRDAEHSARYQIEEFIQEKDNLDIYRLDESNAPKCLKDMLDTLERIVPMYGVPLCEPKEYVCEDGTIIPNKLYQDLKAEDEEQKKLEPSYRETYNQTLEQRTAELKQDLDNCFNSIE